MLISIVTANHKENDENSFEVRTEEGALTCKVNYNEWLIHIEIQKIVYLLMKFAILLMYANLS